MDTRVHDGEKNKKRGEKERELRRQKDEGLKPSPVESKLLRRSSEHADSKVCANCFLFYGTYTSIYVKM